MSKFALSSPAQKRTRTVVDTIEVTPASIQTYQNPPFQRQLTVNKKVKALAEQIREDGGVIPGVMTLGVLNNATYLLDGQHRRHAFLDSGVVRGYVDVRIHYFNSMAEMGEEFVNLNSQLSRLRPDDVLRGLEGSTPLMARLRRACPYVGYNQVRRGPSSPILSMSLLLRAWFGSAQEAPVAPAVTAIQLTERLTEEDVNAVTDFLTLAHKAWQDDPENSRLWAALNLGLCMWLYRNVVVKPSGPRVTKLTKDQFVKCLMALSAKKNYIDWLFGRAMRERDRSPAYGRIKAIFVKRMLDETGKKILLPSPTWASNIRAGVVITD